MSAQKTRADMEEKYAWAHEACLIIQQEGQYYRPYAEGKPAGFTDIPKVKQAFWAFLNAYQTIRFYHGAWVQQTTNQKLGNTYMDSWKSSFLDAMQTQYWDLLNKLRNEDTHKQPVIPEIIVTLRPTGQVVRQAYGPYGSSTSSGIGNYIHLATGSKEIKVIIESIEYQLHPLVLAVLKSMRLFIDTFDQLPNSLIY